MSFQFNFLDPQGGASENKDRHKSFDVLENERELMFQCRVQTWSDYWDIHCAFSKKDENNTVDNLEKCQEVFPTTDLKVEIPFLVYDIGDDFCIKCLDNKEVERSLCKLTELCGAVKAAESHSDLIPNIYEGGLKVWECAVDLVRYLYNNKVSFQDYRVLDLGCGAGIPGIMAVLQGAKEVHFQDYNLEVLQHFTGPNVKLNLQDSEDETVKLCKCRYFGGDWTYFCNHLEKEKTSYDIILTAETIYRPDNYEKLTAVFNKLLAEEGIVYVAAKSSYFGVGGGTQEFKDYIENENLFEVNNAAVIDGDIPRDIIVLKRCSKPRKRKHKDD